jgi:hypothetical protein
MPGRGLRDEVRAGVKSAVVRSTTVAVGARSFSVRVVDAVDGVVGLLGQSADRPVGAGEGHDVAGLEAVVATEGQRLVRCFTTVDWSIVRAFVVLSTLTRSPLFRSAALVFALV